MSDRKICSVSVDNLSLQDMQRAVMFAEYMSNSMLHCAGMMRLTPKEIGGALFFMLRTVSAGVGAVENDVKMTCIEKTGGP